MEGKLELIELKSDLQSYDDLHTYFINNIERIKQEHILRGTLGQTGHQNLQSKVLWISHLVTSYTQVR